MLRMCNMRNQFPFLFPPPPPPPFFPFSSLPPSFLCANVFVEAFVRSMEGWMGRGSGGMCFSGLLASCFRADCSSMCLSPSLYLSLSFLSLFLFSPLHQLGTHVRAKQAVSNLTNVIGEQAKKVAKEAADAKVWIFFLFLSLSPSLSHLLPNTIPSLCHCCSLRLSLVVVSSVVSTTRLHLSLILLFLFSLCFFCRPPPPLPPPSKLLSLQNFFLLKIFLSSVVLKVKPFY